MTDENRPLPILTWEDSYAIAKALKECFPDTRLEDVSLGMVYRWILGLPGFADDPQLANESILADIFRTWYEETDIV